MNAPMHAADREHATMSGMKDGKVASPHDVRSDCRALCRKTKWDDRMFGELPLIHNEDADS